MDIIQTSITKKSGERALFDPEKLKRSLERSGAGENEILEIVDKVKVKLYDGISTHKIYQMAYAILKKRSHKSAGRYRLKRAILDLGPTGYPFERFIGALLKNQGYKVQVGIIVQGHCVQHEVDVVAQKENKKIIIECKFHRNTSRKSDVKVSLYIHSRFLDIKKQYEKSIEGNTHFHQGWLVTNTRFTNEAIQYGKCAGLKLVSWDYPHQGSLREWIDNSGLHPITALQTVTKKEKQQLLENEVVLCRELVGNEKLLRSIGIRERMIPKIINEAKELITPTK